MLIPTMALHLNRMQAKSINFGQAAEIGSSDIIISLYGWVWTLQNH